MEYERVYREYYRKVTRYLGNRVGRSEAEDLAQEVFIKVGRGLKDLKDPSKLSSWIFRIALNTARDRFRRLSAGEAGQRCSTAEPEAEAGEEAPADVADARSPNPEERLERGDMIRCYFDFVKKLPRNFYEVYVLSEFEELPDKAVSARLSLPLETVKMRLHRARAKLYAELRTHCRCYYNERGELMGDLKRANPAGSEEEDQRGSAADL